MSILEVEDEALQVDTVDCGDTKLLNDGRRISVPLRWLPRLLEATPAQRAAWRVMPFGDAIEWQEIDEHVSVEGLLRGSRPRERSRLVEGDSGRLCIAGPKLR